MQRHDVNSGEGQALPEHLHPDTPGLPDGYCGSCYGAEAEDGACCNSCEAVRAAYRTRGWVMPEYETVEQCKREGFKDSILSVVRARRLGTRDDVVGQRADDVVGQRCQSVNRVN